MQSAESSTRNQGHPTGPGTAKGSRSDDPRALALERCTYLINYYRKRASDAGNYFRVAQVLTIVLAGATPVLLLISEVPKWAGALPSALAAITAGIAGSMKWQQDWARFTETGEALESERIKFMTHAIPDYQVRRQPPETESAVISAFVQRVEALTLGETVGWRTQIVQEPVQARPDQSGEVPRG